MEKETRKDIKGFEGQYMDSLDFVLNQHKTQSLESLKKFSKSVNDSQDVINDIIPEELECGINTVTINNGVIKSTLIDPETKNTVEIIIMKSQNNNFQYFTKEDVVTDGTLVHEYISMAEILRKMCRLGTAFDPLVREIEGKIWDKKIIYEIGDFVVLNNNNFKSEKYPEYLHTRLKVCLPIKMSYEEVI